LQEELEGDDDAAARGVFPIIYWPFLESRIAEGGGVENVEGGSGSCDVDILRLTGTANREERGTANEDKAVAEILREGHCGVESFKQCGLLASSDDGHFDTGYKEFSRSGVISTNYCQRKTNYFT
jgi:hypothetical protein